MAILQFTDTDGNRLPDIDRVNGDDGPTITIVVCEPGMCIDVTSKELRFVPAPPPPVIERVEVAEVTGIDVGNVVVAPDMGDLALQLAAIEEHTAKMTGEPVRPDLIMRRYLGLE